MKTLLRTPRRRVTSLAAVLVLSGLCVAGLVASTAAGSGQDKITLRVSLFGDFGYHDLYARYEASHPNIDIKEDVENYADHHANLAKHLAVGSGADDIESVEVGFIAQFKSKPNLFVDLNKLGAKKLQKQWLTWKWRQSLAPNGAQIGLGTDVGSLAICYRRDLFRKAGLPSSRAAVSKLWPTWQQFVATGKHFEKNAPNGVRFFDSGSNVYKAILAHESAGLAAFSNDWNTGFKSGTFATVTCPAWMMGYIQGQAPNTRGKWDIAAVPGGGGNWGGSFLTVPKQGSHAKEAYDLAKFLTSPAAEAYVFKHTGNLPSQPALYRLKAVATFKNPFFNNAPVGKIFTTSAKQLKPQITGPHQGDIQTAVSNAIQRVEQHKQSPQQSWKQFLKDVKAVT